MIARSLLNKYDNFPEKTNSINYVKLINKFRQLDADMAPKFRKFGEKFREDSRVPRGALFRKKRAVFGQNAARGAG